MKIKLLVIFSVLFVNPGFGQLYSDTLYLDNRGEICYTNDYEFMRIIEQNMDSRYSIRDYYASGELKREYEFISKKKYTPNSLDFLKIYETKNLKLDGVLVSYYMTGEKEEEAFFQKGRQIGDHLSYTEEGDTMYIIIEDLPIFPGGLDSLLAYIHSELVYPEQAAEEKIQGRVILQFVVNRKGYIENVEVIQGVHPLLDNEARRVVESFPRWTPGKQRGKPVSVYFTFPINFILPESDEQL